MGVQITGTGFTWSGKTDAEGKLTADVPMNATTAIMVVAAETEAKPTTHDEMRG